MLPRPHGIPIQINRAVWLAGMVLLFLPLELIAAPSRHNVICREELSPSHREQLAAKLRKITGLEDVRFDDDGLLRSTGNRFSGGSESARKLLAQAIAGDNAVVIEEANNRADVAFCRVIPGKWKNDAAGKPPVFVVQIDFADFDQTVGDARAFEAFNVGWGLLHELDHVVNDSADALTLGETGECEVHLNQMRRECNLPERAGYFSTLSPLAMNTSFMTRLVRLAFEEQKPGRNKKERYWIMWDANVVGGLEQNQIAALR
jgi:hypothetical protein